MVNVEVSSQLPMPAPKRLGILDPSLTPTAMLGIVSLTPGLETTVNVSLGAESDEAVQRLRSLIDFDALAAKADGTRTLDDFVADISQLVLGAGLHIEELPSSDLHIEIHVDTKTGRIVSTQKAEHPFAATNDDIVTRAHQSLVEKFARIPTELANRIEAATTAGDHDAAAGEVRAAMDGGLFGFAPNLKLLTALLGIDLKTIDTSKKTFVRDGLIIVAHQLNKMDIASDQAEFMLAERDYLTDEQKLDLEMVIANGAIQRGQVETAMSIWRRLLKRPDALGVHNRAWAWRNLSLALGPTHPESMAASRHSADAFLEAGDKEEAGRSMMGLVKALLHRSPKEALEVLNEIEALCDQEGLRNIQLRASLSHIRGNRLSALGNHEAALDNALRAVEFLRGLLGAEPELISSLYLVQQELHWLRRVDEAKAFESEADILTEKTKHGHFQLAKRVISLSDTFDPAEAAEILSAAEEQQNHEVTSAVQTLLAVRDPSLNDTQRLSRLEACLSDQERKGFSASAKAPTRIALANQLVKMGEFGRAEGWFRRILTHNPIDQHARDAIIHILCHQGNWGDAAIFLRQQIPIWGELPGLTAALGQSLLKSGNLSDAVQQLTKAANLAVSDPQLKQAVLAMREEALQLGGTIEPAKAAIPLDAVVSTEDFERALSEFSRFVQADKRMTFWQRGDDDHQWISHPEQHAQNLLHTFLKGKFGERIAVFEEIAAGAGRIDLYVQLRKGISAVVELKLCGYRYSSSYAASGEEQVLHYMQNRGTYLGYLVVFDARLNDNGKQLLPKRSADQFTVAEILCDVRPRVKKTR